MFRRRKRKFTREQTLKFIEDNFVTCKKCGYNNRKELFHKYGVCLCCGDIIDGKTYFKAKYYKTRQRMLRNENKEKTGK